MACSFHSRLGALSRQVDKNSAIWNLFDYNEDTQDSEIPCEYLVELRRVLLFHFAVILDINECQREFIDYHQLECEKYLSVLRSDVVRETIEFNIDLSDMTDELPVLFKTSSSEYSKHAPEKKQDGSHQMH